MEFDIIKLACLLAWILSGVYLLDKINSQPKKMSAFVGDPNAAGKEWLILFFGPGVLLYHFLKNLTKSSFFASARGLFAAKKNYDITILDSRGASMFSSDCNNPAIDELKEIIHFAITKCASDIFIDPAGEGQYNLRFRIDGSLFSAKTMPFSFGENVVNAIKVSAGMDISEKRRPQDGSFAALYQENKTSFRVASVGAFGGEKVAIRLLGTDAGPKSLEEIGFSAEQLELLKNSVSLSSGMILMCGGTGSGKTTTLYALINNIDYTLKNVISIEDPVERVIPNISQMEVNSKADITFAGILRNALRQNPDVICLGEIRDEETAEIAVHAAQTGHLIISTVHSNDAVDTLDRLAGLGIPLRSLAATLKVIVNQRLARKLCPHCKEPCSDIPAKWLDYFSANNISADGVCKAVGCPECNGTGYLGRVACLDVLMIDNILRAELEKENVSLSQIKAIADNKNNSHSMVYHGAMLAASGVSSIDEISRITLTLDGALK